MANSPYSIELGVHVRTSDIRKQISAYNANSNNAKLQLGVKLNTADLKKQIQSLNINGGKNLLSIDTKTLEASLDRVAADIKEIRAAFGTIDGKSNMNNLLTSINQISVALENATKQFVDLNASLNSLAGKSFGINIGLNLGGSAAAQQSAYGDLARSTIIPQLKQQVSNIVQQYNAAYKTVESEQQALINLVSKTKLATPAFFNDIMDKNGLFTRMGDSTNLKQQIAAYREYISLFEKAASLKNPQLAASISGASQEAEQLATRAAKARAGVTQLDDSLQKLKGVFGSGVDAEKLSTQLDSIVADLGEIKTALQGLSQNASLEGLTQNFKELSLLLKELTSNFTLVRNNLTSGVSGAGSGVTSITQRIKEADIKVDDMKGSVESLKGALQGLGFNSVSIDAITKDFDELGISVKNVTTRLRSDGNVVLSIKGIDQYERAVTLMRSIGKDGKVNNLGTSISQSFKETEVAFNRLKVIASEMKNLKVGIAGLDPQKDSAKIETLTSQLNKLQAEYRELYGITGQNLSTTQIDVLKQKSIDTANAVKKVKAAMADTSAIQKQTQAFKGLSVVSKEIGNLEIGIAKLKSQGGNAAQIEVLEQQLRELQAAYQHLVTTMNTPLTNEQWSSIYTQITQTQDKLTQLDAKVVDTKAKLASKIQGNFGNYEAQIVSLEGKFNRLATKPSEVSTGLEMLKQALTSLKTADSTDEIIAANNRYLTILKQVNAQINLNANAERNSNDAIALQQQKQALALKMSNWLRDNSAAAKQFGVEIQNLQVQLKNCGNMSGVQQIGRDFQNVTLKAKEAGLTALSFGDRLKKQFAQYSSYFSVYSLFMYGTMAMRSMFEQVKSIDSAMTELKKVTNETADSYNRFLTNAADKSKEIGTTIDGLVSSTADFARLGYGFEDAQGLAEVANIYAVVGDEIDGVEQATESLISTMAAFKDSAGDMSNSDFAMSIIDKFNEIGNNFAISSGGIGEALERSASSLMAANNTLDESIALITAANTVVQDPEQVGTAFKTISMRIRGAKTELEEAGLETEGMVESTAKLRSEILALSGVDIMENANEFKSTYKIMDELAAKWEDLSDIQQATITELIAGKRQGNIVSSLMSNFDTAREALDTSMNSAGSAMQEHEKWMKSVEASINKVKAAWQSLSQSFLKSDFLKGLLGTVANLADGFSKLLDTFGTLPTLIGLVAGGMSLFGKGGFFKVATNELTGFATGITTTFGQAAKSVNHSLSTINLDKGFSKTLNRNDISSIRAYSREIKNGATHTTAFANTMSDASDEAKAYIQNVKPTSQAVTGFVKSQQAAEVSTLAQNKSLGSARVLMKEYHSGCKTTGMAQKDFANAVRQTNPQLAAAMTSTNGVKSGMISYTASLIGAKVATAALKVATMALNIALTMGIGMLVSFAIEGIMKVFNGAKELAEQVEELTSKFKEQHEELKKLKGDYDTTNEDSMISKYAKLSKGVDNLGRNVSLTADEYSEYQSIVNKIADQIPSLVSGYDSQGNALLSCKGNIEELTTAYEKLIHVQNQEILSRNNADIEKNWKNTLEQVNGYDFWEAWGNDLSFDGFFGGKIDDFDMKTGTAKWLGSLTSSTSIDTINDYFDSDEGGSGRRRNEVMQALRNAGYDVGFWSSQSKISETLKEALENEPEKIKGILDDYYAQFEEDIVRYKTKATALLSEAFDVSSAISGLTYENISEDLQTVAYQVVNSLDFEDLNKLSEKGIAIEDWVKNMLDQFNDIDSDKSAKISAAFDLQTQFNGGEISYGEYVKGLEDTGKLIDGLGLDDEFESQLKLSLGLDEDGLVAGFKQLKNRLASNEYFDIMPSDYAPFIESLSSEELSVLWKVIPELEATDYKEDIADIKSALELEMMLQGLNFDLNIEVEAAGLEALNTALAESVSATGLSSESIDALKGRYADLEAQGYDLSSMFEETSTGIRLNRQEFNKLENAYATEKLAEVDGELTEMKSTYDDLGEAIKNCDDPVRKSELFNDRQTLAKRISEAATLAHQYKGLTNAYNDWLSAEEAGQERDMYENVIKGFETIDDEISRGWIDDSAIEFLELLTGRTDLAGKSGKQLKEIYDSLDGAIKNTTYSVRDFFTVDEDGNSTNAGVYNFLDAIGQLEEEKFGGKDIVKRDKDGNIISFDFELAGGDEVIAEALGVSEELVQIMVRAADDAGFVVSMDGTYRQLADLQNEAKAAADYLHQIGKTDFEFDFNTSSVENLKTQLEEAHKILDSKEFWNKDGTFNFNADGATQAMQVVSTLQAKLDKLTEEKYGIGLTVEDEEFEEPLENLQEYGRKVATLNQLELNPKANAEEIEELNGELDEIAEYFANLDKDTKVELGFEADDGIEEVKKKIESGEIKIPTVLDIQANMDKNIETLADLALLNSGLLSESEEEVIRKKYKVEVEADEVDTTDVDNKVDNTLRLEGRRTGKHVAKRKENIEIIAETFGIDDVEDLTSKLKGLDDKTVQAIVEAVGRIDVEKLQQTMALIKPKNVKAIAKAIGKGDVDKLRSTIKKLDPKTVQAIAEALGYDNVNELDAAIEGMDGNTVQAIAEALGITDVESLQSTIDNMRGNTVDAKVNTDGQADKVHTLQSEIDGLHGKNVFINVIKTVWEKITSGGKKKAAQRTGADLDGESRGGRVNGTANVNGTTGRAFARGNWRTKKTETALTGELGREIVVTPDNHWYTVGDTGAEFATIPKGSIVFNHKQTEELFKNGKVTSGGGRGKAFVEGTAFSKGTGGFGKVTSRASAVTADDEGEVKTTTKSSKKKKNVTVKNTTEVNVGGSQGSGGGADKADGSAVGSNQKDADKFEETFDGIAVIIDRVERAIDNLDKKVNNVYSSWSERNTALKDEISKVQYAINMQEAAADRYLKEANNVGLDKRWVDAIQHGSINIYDESDFDEETYKKIQEYKQWYELYLQCTDAAEDLKETESSLYQQRFEHIQSQYDGILQGYEHTESMLNEYISQAEEKGHIVSKNYYQALIDNEKNNITALNNEKAALIKARDEAVASGKIAVGSQAWHDMCAEIDSVTQAIEEGNTAIIKYGNSIRDIDWQVFDLIQERVSDVTSEADFLIELMSNDKLFDDNGKFTDKGMATIGLHGQNYDTYMYQANDYGNKVAEIDRKIASGELDPYSQDVINKRREYVELQRESILNAENEKQAIKDLVEEGINIELDALQERIDLHNEELESMKDLYDYQKNVRKQSEEIASLEKQRAAYLNDDSEESRAKLQEITVSLKEAKEDLQETEFDRYISQQSQLLDSLYEDYELILNQRLDNIDALMADMITATNDNATTISTTLNTAATDVGTVLSTAMQNIWNGESGDSAKSVLTSYGDKITGESPTSLVGVLNGIKTDVNAMVDDVDKEAKEKVESDKTDTSGNDKVKTPEKKPKEEPKKKEGSKRTITGDDIMGIASAIWIYGKNAGWGNDPFRSGRLTAKLGDANAKKVQKYINEYSTNGKLYDFWIKKGKNLDKYNYSAFATGAKDIDKTQLAWTQEKGQEYIIRPSDGAILTPVAKSDSILNAQASSNIWDMANSPAEFIKDNLSLGATNVPNNSNVQNNTVQHFENITFSMPNVKNYEQLLSEMQKDKSFEKLILSMTIDQIAGKSSLAKGKSIR